MRSRRFRVAIAALAVSVLVGGLAAAASAAPGKKPTGEPLIFGMYNQEDSPLGSFAEYRLGVEAGVKYVNEELSGIQKRPMRLNKCITKGSPDSTIGCATELLSQNPAAIFGGFDIFAPAALPTYAQSGIPILGGGAVTVPELTMESSVRFTGWVVSGFTAMPLYAAKTLKAKKVAVIDYPDLPGGRIPFENYIKPVLEKNGVKDVVSVPASLGATDLTPVLAAAAQDNPDVIIQIAIPNQCVLAMQAKQSLGITAKLMLPADCSDPGVLQNAGAAAEGVYFGYQFLAPNSKDKDVRTFLKAMKKYGAKNTPITEITQAGFSQVLNTWEVLNKAPASALASSQSILDAFKATSNQHNFMAHPYTCNGNQVPGLPAVCDAHNRIYVVKGGKLVDDGKKWLNGSGDIVPPSASAPGPA